MLNVTSPMEGVVNLAPSNRFRVLPGDAQCFAAVTAVVAAIALSSPALANKITFEAASVGAFAGPITEDGFTYSKSSGELRVEPFGNPGQDAEGCLSRRRQFQLQRA
jgi:hypothetical protein